MFTNAWTILHLVNWVAPAIGIEPDDVAIYALVHLMKASVARHIKREEWLSLFTQPDFKKVGSIGELKTPLQKQTNAILGNPNSSKVFYNSLFDWVKETEARKILTAEEALDMWTLLIPKVRPNWFLQKEFEGFLEKVVADEKNKKNVSKDTWTMLIPFIDESNKTPTRFVSSYEMDGAWPVLMDEFILHLRSSQKKV